MNQDLTQPKIARMAVSRKNNDVMRVEYLPKGSSEFSAVEECWRQGKFFWIGDDFKRSMFGLSHVNSVQRFTLHLAFEIVKIDELLKIVLQYDAILL